MTPTIEANASSLKLSYLRFIADSSPGLLLLFGLLVAETNGWLPFALTPKEAAPRTFAAILAFLLATPIGLMINGIGHVLLGSIQTYVVRRCLTSRVWPIANTHEGLRVRRWTKYFGIQERDWPRIADEVDDLLDTFAPHLSAKIDHVRALKRFCRSLALLALATIFVLAGRHGAIAAGVLLGTLIIGVVLNARDGSARTAALVVCSAETVLIGCWPDHVLAASALFAVAVAAICFAGFFEFHQYAYVMLLLYQLLVTREKKGAKLSAETVRAGLLEIVRSLNPSIAPAPVT